MKKSTKIAIIAGVSVFVILFIILAVVLTMFFINLTKEKPSITASDFYSIMREKGYSVKSADSQLSDYDYIKKVYVAVSKDSGYQIEFYEFTDDFYASEFYDNNQYIIESSKGMNSAYTNVELKNYAKYTLLANGKYRVISRINNTAIYLDVNSNYKDIVKDLLDELGY